MQHLRTLLALSLSVLFQLLVHQLRGQCVPPPALSPFQCGNCTEIHIFYCEKEPQPLSISHYIQQNSSYAAGAGLKWYQDNNGIKGNLLAGEPAPDVRFAQTFHYWVSQEVNGCEGSATRVKVKTRPTPWLVVDSTIPFCYPYAMDVAGQVIDRRGVTSLFAYYDVAPGAGTTPFTNLTAVGGQLSPASQSIFRAPPVNTSYWVVGINEFNLGSSCTDTVSFTIIPHTVPQITPNQDIYICEGEWVFPPSVQSVTPPSLIFWSNSNTAIGLGTNGFGNPPPFLAPSGLQAPDTSYLVYYVLGGACFTLDSIAIYLEPKPRLEVGLTDTVCSRESGQLSLSISNQVSGTTSYHWPAPILTGGLQGNALSGSGPGLQGTFSNTESGTLKAIYEVTAVSTIGCSSKVEKMVIVVKPEPVISPVSDTYICSSEAAQLQFSTQNQLVGVTYSWTAGLLPAGLQGLNGAPTPSSGTLLGDAFVNSSSQVLPVTYLLEAEAEGCMGQPQNMQLDVYPIQPVGSLQLAVCEDLAGSSQGLFNLQEVNNQLNGIPITAFFSDPELTQDINSPQAYRGGNHIVYGTRPGTAPCPETWRIQLSVQKIPNIPLGIQDEGCQGTRFSLIPGPGNAFRFYDADPSTGSAQLIQDTSARFDTLLLDPSAPVEIWVSAYDGLCESTASKSEIEVLTLPDLYHISSNSPLCAGDDLALRASTSNAATFSWRSSNLAFSGTDSVAAIPDIGLSDSGMYYLTISSSQGCSYADSVHISVLLPPYAGLDSTVHFCDGTPPFNLFDALGAGASTNGFWTGPSSVNNGYLGLFDPTQTAFGTYTFNLTGHVCQRSPRARVEVLYFPFPAPTLTANSPLFEEDDLHLQANDGLTYNWSGPNGFSASGDAVNRINIALEDSGFYTVRVSNAGGCTSEDSIFVQVDAIPILTFELAVFLEGAFDENTGLMQDSLRTKGAIPLREPYTAMNFNLVGGGGEQISPQVLQVSGPDAIVDWVFLDLRDPNDSMLTVASRACLLQRDGDIVDLDGFSKPVFRWLNEGFYYVVIDHRNHLSAMTAMPVYLDNSATVSVDFRDVATPLFGFTPVKVVGNQALLFAGDANGDGQIQVVDLVNFWIPAVGTSGYINADWNMDTQVQNIDFLGIWVPNAGRGSQVPGKAF